VVLLKPATKLAKLRGIDSFEGASEELDELREEWDEEFEHG
jgi:hypothetical protein